VKILFVCLGNICRSPTAEVVLRTLAAREAPELEPLRPWLEPLVRAERVTRHDTPPLIASVYHLIDRGAGAAYLAAVERVALAAARVVATGPWPPYAFAPEALG